MASQYRLWYSAVDDERQSILAADRAAHPNPQETQYTRDLQTNRQKAYLSTHGWVRYTRKFVHNVDAHYYFQAATDRQEEQYQKDYPDAVMVGVGEAPDGFPYLEPYPVPFERWWPAGTRPKEEPKAVPTVVVEEQVSEGKRRFQLAAEDDA